MTDVEDDELSTMIRTAFLSRRKPSRISNFELSGSDERNVAEISEMEWSAISYADNERGRLGFVFLNDIAVVSLMPSLMLLALENYKVLDSQGMASEMFELLISPNGENEQAERINDLLTSQERYALCLWLGRMEDRRASNPAASSWHIRVLLEDLRLPVLAFAISLVEAIALCLPSSIAATGHQ